MVIATADSQVSCVCAHGYQYTPSIYACGKTGFKNPVCSFLNPVMSEKRLFDEVILWS